MENQRIFLWAALAFVLVLIYQAWQQDYGPRPPVPGSQGTEQSRPDASGEDPIAEGELPDPDRMPSAELDTAPEPSMGEAGGADAAADTGAGRRIEVVTDVLRLVISTQGGDIRIADLLQYPVTKDEPDEPVRLFDDSGEAFYILQSGLNTSGEHAPNHRAVFETPRDSYRLADGQDSLEVPLTWTSPEGVTVTKVFRLERGDYAVKVEYRVENASGEDWTALPYMQLVNRDTPQDRSMFDVDTYSYRGPVYYAGDHYEKLDVEDLAEEPFETRVTGGWIAILQHYFVGAVIPRQDSENLIEARHLAGGRYLVRAVDPRTTVAAGGEGSIEQTFWVGPKLQDELSEVADGLDLSVDYGFLHLLSKPLFVVLAWIHGLVGNWGWAIIILTILIKLAFYKLSATSGRSMARMRKIQPRLKKLQERYKDDRQKLNQAMMELYKEEKINPAAGCLPILVQIPVFLALYWVLLESAELRQASFALWIQDLSSRDPYFVLPVLMGLSMLVQQKLNPAPPDPIQAKIMMVLPVVFSFFFAFFPAGLVLYWFTNNLLSIAQQWRINQIVEREK